MNFIYCFMHRAFDMTKMHYCFGDTDSMYWAISNEAGGFPIKDKFFYDKYANLFFTDQKKILGIAIEKEGDCLFALAPKSYCMKNKDEVIAMRTKSIDNKCAVKIDGTLISIEDYQNTINDNPLVKVEEKRYRTKKNGDIIEKIISKHPLTAMHTKMICLPNGSCLPFL